ncbi:MAG: asparagine synthase-related protein [Actinomycetota bacterium]
MSGIAGVWNLNGQPVDPETLIAMGSRMAHRGPDGIFTDSEDSWGLVCALSKVAPESRNETQPARHESGAIAVFDGRLDNRQELLGALGGSVPKDAPDSQLLANAYAHFGDRLPEKLNGDYAFAVFDPIRQRLILSRDAIGMRPLFYFRSTDAIVFGSEIKAILAHPDVSVAPDEQELAIFVLAGSPQGDGRRTFFRGIERILPSNVVMFEPDRSASRMYWDFDPWFQLRLPSFDDYAEGFREYFERAVVHRLRSAHPVAISLSGGLDSSSIFCLAETLRRAEPGHFPRLVPLTFSPMDGTLADEHEFLTDIKRQYGVEVIDMPSRASPPTATTREVVWATEHPAVETMWEGLSAFWSRAKNEGARVLITGHLGDQFVFDRSYLVDLFDGLRWRDIYAHLREYPRWYTEADTTPLSRGFFRQVVRDHLPASLLPVARRARAAIRPPTLDNPWYSDNFRRLASQPVSSPPFVRSQFASAHAASIYAQARGRQIMLALEWDNLAHSARGLDLCFPFADRDLISYLMSIPGEMSNYGGVPRMILREAMKDVIPNSVRNRRWKATYGRIMEDALHLDEPQLLSAAGDPRTAARLGFVDPGRVRRRLETAREAGPNDETLWECSTLLGLEVWAETFFPGGPESH